MFPMHRSYGLQGSLKRPTSLSQVKAGTHSALRKGSHTRAYTPKQWPSRPRPQCGSVPPAKFLLFRHALYTYISRFPVNPHYQQQFYLRPFFIVFFNFLHKWPTFAFTPESGYTLGFQRKIAHNGTHGETGGVSDGGAITTLGAFCAVRKPCAAGCQNGALCRFGGLVGGTPEEHRKPSGQRCAYACPLPPALRPRWAA